MKVLITLLCLSVLSVSCTLTQPKKEADFNKDINKYSYAIGADLAFKIKQQKVKVDKQHFIMGFEDVLEANKSKLTKEERLAAYKILRAEGLKVRDQAAQKNRLAGENFLVANKMKPGVIVTKTGLQYKIIKKGTGGIPLKSDTVEVNYVGRTIDGKEFDSSYKRGKSVTFKIQGIIRGWQEILQVMKEGAKYQIFVPAELAYGKRGNYKIAPNSVLIFEIELIRIVKTKETKETKENEENKGK
jgi:FKBP-type peptidyl-prolyl cis-trans isomerase FklB